MTMCVDVREKGLDDDADCAIAGNAMEMRSECEERERASGRVKCVFGDMKVRVSHTKCETFLTFLRHF